MKEAHQLVYSQMEKMGAYNKLCYDKKARGAEIEVGDHVLLRNLGKDAAGKIRSHWEQRLWTVIKKEENVPVFTIRILSGLKKKRVHRNLLMKADQLSPELLVRPL